MHEESSQQDRDQLLQAKDEQILTQTQEIVDKTHQLEAKETEVYHLTKRLEQSAQQLQLQDVQLQAQDEVLDAKEAETRQLQQTLEQSTSDKLVLQHEAEGKERQLRRLNQLVESNEEITAALQQAFTQKVKEVSELEQVLSSKDHRIQDISSQLQELESRGKNTQATFCSKPGRDWVNIEWQQQPTIQDTPATQERVDAYVTWRSSSDAPNSFEVGSSTVDGDKAYFRSKGSQVVLEYNFKLKQWCAMPKHVIASFTIVCVDHVLTTVGGRFGGDYNNKLYSLIENLVGRKWVEHFPPMPTQLGTPAAVYTNNTLVVAGGFDGTCLAIVEVLDTQTNQWAIASSLPIPISQASAVVHENCIYISAGYGYNEEGPNPLLKCSLSTLLQSTQRATPKVTVWENHNPLPIHWSSLAVVEGHLIAVGGKDSKDNPTKDIYRYDPTTNSWEVVSQMSVARSDCLTAVLPGNKLMVVGYTKNLKDAKKVEIGTFSFGPKLIQEH